MIRIAERADVPHIQGIANQAYAPVVPLIGRPPAPMVADFATAVRLAEAWVWGTTPPCAFIIFRVTTETALIENVAVAPPGQGQGIGRQLIHFAEETARKSGAQRMTLYTNAMMTANLSYYPKLGYIPTGRAIQDGFDRVFFEKEIGREISDLNS